MATFQLRRYKVRSGEMQEWLEEWSAKIRPLREQLGFQVVGAWRGGDDEFVWIVRYDGALAWEDAERAYYEAPERKALDPDPARHLEKVEQLVMTPV